MSLSYIGPDGIEYATGCLPRVTVCGTVAPVYAGEACPRIDRSEWTAQQPLDAYEYADENQNPNNSCCLTSLAIALEKHFSINGREKIRPDWLKIWRKLTRGRNVGVGLDKALAEILKNGFPIQGSTDVIELAEVWDVPDVDSFISGIYRGCVGTYGRFIGRLGHAECAYYMKDAKTVRVRGSWGKSYGQNGWYDVPLADLERGIPYFGAILIREVKLRPGDVSGMEDAKA